MIREATIKDVPEIFQMSISFLNEAKILDTIPLNKEDLYSWVINLINDTNSTCLVYDEDSIIKGAIAGTIAPHYTNKSYLVASEFAWWVVPEYRGKIGKPLLQAFELWAVTNNANMVIMAALEEISPELLGRVYKSLGYSTTEHSYTKVIK